MLLRKLGLSAARQAQSLPSIRDRPVRNFGAERLTALPRAGMKA